MSYIDGMVIPVTTARKGEYRKMAEDFQRLLKEFGATRVVDCWGTDVPDGKLTDLKKAVRAEPSETVVLSWVVWPSKEARDAGNAKLRTDPRAQMSGDVPFNMQRMIFGGFDVLLDTDGELKP